MWSIGPAVVAVIAIQLALFGWRAAGWALLIAVVAFLIGKYVDIWRDHRALRAENRRGLDRDRDDLADLRMKVAQRAERADVAKALSVLERVPDAPVAEGDELEEGSPAASR